MQLSPAQIEGLPPEQKAQVLALQQQMVSFCSLLVNLVLSAIAASLIGCFKHVPACALALTRMVLILIDPSNALYQRQGLQYLC